MRVEVSREQAWSWVSVAALFCGTHIIQNCPNKITIISNTATLSFRTNSVFNFTKIWFYSSCIFRNLPLEFEENSRRNTTLYFGDCRNAELFFEMSTTSPTPLDLLMNATTNYLNTSIENSTTSSDYYSEYDSLPSELPLAGMTEDEFFASLPVFDMFPLSFPTNGHVVLYAMVRHCSLNLLFNLKKIMLWMSEKVVVN